MSTGEWLEFWSIPVFTGAIGWLINWSGVLMLFNPVRFHGVTVPGMRELVDAAARASCRRSRGSCRAAIGWQGIVPARAAKMGSIAVDKAIAKLGTPAEFYQQLEPEKIAEHIVTMFQPAGPGDRRRHHAPRAAASCGRASRRGVKQAVYRARAAAAARHRPPDHGRDRRAHRPAAGPEDHGHRPLHQEPGARQQDLPRLRRRRS